MPRVTRALHRATLRLEPCVCVEGGVRLRPCMVRLPLNRQTDKNDWKHYTFRNFVGGRHWSLRFVKWKSVGWDSLMIEHFHTQQKSEQGTKGKLDSENKCGYLGKWFSKKHPVNFYRLIYARPKLFVLHMISARNQRQRNVQFLLTVCRTPAVIRESRNQVATQQPAGNSVNSYWFLAYQSILIWFYNGGLWDNIFGSINK